MLITVITIFPDFFAGPLSLSIPARAAAASAVTYRIVDLRDYTHDRHRTVDDYPYGGGAGMVMKPEPLVGAIEAAREAMSGPARVILMDPQGRRFTQKVARGGWRVYEVPISYRGRDYAEGKKIGWKDGVSAIYTILKYRFMD